MSTWRHDLVCLVADKNMEQAMRGLLGRHQSLGIRAIRWQIHVHPQRDPGCCTRSPEFLRLFVNQAAHALVLFDHEGSGRETTTRETLEAQLEAQLRDTGWGERAAAIVIAPELEAWVWSDSPNVDSGLGWEGKTPDLRTWLQQQDYLEHGQSKPSRPKEAVEAALEHVLQPRSSTIYAALAAKVSLGRCIDPSFVKLKTVLGQWFAAV